MSREVCCRTMQGKQSANIPNWIQYERSKMCNRPGNRIAGEDKTELQMFARHRADKHCAGRR